MTRKIVQIYRINHTQPVVKKFILKKKNFANNKNYNFKLSNTTTFKTIYRNKKTTVCHIKQKYKYKYHTVST